MLRNTLARILIIKLIKDINYFFINLNSCRHYMTYFAFLFLGRVLDLSNGQRSCNLSEICFLTSLLPYCHQLHIYLLHHKCFLLLLWNYGGSHCGLMAKMLDCNLKVSKFELQSFYYVHFQVNTLGKGMKPFILSLYGVNNISAVPLQVWLWH